LPSTVSRSRGSIQPATNGQRVGLLLPAGTRAAATRAEQPHLPPPWGAAPVCLARGPTTDVVRRHTPYYTGDVGEELIWDEGSAAYIRSRPGRYPGGRAIEPEWTQQVLDDIDLITFEPDPKSRMGASRFIGRSDAAGRVLVVIAFRDVDGDLHGINAWPASGADLRYYEEGIDDDEDD
jgi:hypothetical protein